MYDNDICPQCGKDCELPCAALSKIYRIFTDLRTDEKTEIIRSLRKELNLIDYEVANDLKELGEKLINALPELHYIKDYDIKVGYVRSFERKRDKGKSVNAECRKVNGTYTAYLPFDFIITFFEPNMYYMTENQQKILMLHELKHIGMGQRGLKIENHSIEDFKSILYKFGIEWNEYDQDVPDILNETMLAGGDNVKDTKGHKLETKRKANSNSRTSSKSRGQKNKKRENE